MLISVINLSNGSVSNKKLQEVIRAVNRQVKEDFMPYWGFGATLRLEGKSSQKPSETSAADLRGDAILYVWDAEDDDDAAGYHDKNNRGIPYGVVYLKLAKKLDKNWSITFSHEALELIADPEVNLLVAGPHPNPKIKRKVLHDYEMCDAVQGESYVIDGVHVCNFVLPLYFTGGDEYEGRNDFLGTIHKDGSTLKSFGANPGGYINFYDPHTRKYQSYWGKDDKEAEKRMAIKKEMKVTRRGTRYARHFKQ
ncbi:MAG TPA: hypothetical protein VL651_06305 [Bacteroidia bacterium]|jgi:hypothetical protein|nr:hypothetical protein [Bacteroidia bacterium]